MKFARFDISRTIAAPFALAAAVLLAGCDQQRQVREFLWTPDMHFSPALKAQEPNPFTETGEMFRPVEGTVPVNFQPYTISNEEADELASALVNPLPMTEAVLRVGERYYNIYCVACHSSTGDGLGSVVRARAGMPQPPSLFSEKLVDEWTDGRIYHVLTVGQGNMPAYAAKITPEQRWAITHYVRSLQRAALPSEDDLREAEELESRRTFTARPASSQ